MERVILGITEHQGEPMKTALCLGSMAFVLASFLTGCGAADREPEEALVPSDEAALTGNGGPSGSHYQVNIIGVPKNKTASMTSGQRIFVPLDGTTKILLSEGDFNVLDANGTDANGASFQLPCPDADNDGITSYSVFVRALGKPGGQANIDTCAYSDTTATDSGGGVLVDSGTGVVTDTSSNELYCNSDWGMDVDVKRDKGKSTFTNVSKNLLYVYADLDGNGTPERYPLFDDALQDYFWQYDNTGLRIAQMRFYEIATNVN